MPGPRRCFAAAKALRRLDAALLCEVLRKFPAYLKDRGLTVPAHPKDGALDYEGMRAACMAGDTGTTGMRIIDAILGGCRDYAQMARLRDRRL